MTFSRLLIIKQEPSNDKAVTIRENCVFNQNKIEQYKNSFKKLNKRNAKCRSIIFCSCGNCLICA